MTQPEQPMPADQVDEHADSYVWQEGDIEVEEDDGDDGSS